MRLDEWQSKAISFPACLKRIWLLCAILLILTVTAFAAPILKQGSEGHDVVVLQQNLKKLGYPVELDGVFDTTTFNAVVAFQKEENLPQTGMVDRATWHALQAMASQKTESDAVEQNQPPAIQDVTSAEELPEPPSTSDRPSATDSADLPDETVPTQESAPPKEQESQNASTIHPQPAILPAPKKAPPQISQTPVPETKSPKPPETPASPESPASPQKPSEKPVPKKEEPKAETKETKTPPKAEKVPEQAPFLPKNKVDAVIKTAKKHIGTKYIFGGTTPKGFDCSGFVQYVFKQNGFSLPRTADEQYKLGKRVKKRAELEPGDLVFFTTYEKGASHCGIYLGKNQFIHVSSSKGVRIDSLDDTYWKPRWYGGKHIVK